ncbi:MAG: hypothetical protein ACK4TN_06835, partial [Brevinematales bacterium]
RCVIEYLEKEVSVFIYTFPRLVYRSDEDSCGDFYLYIKERLEPIWQQWDENLTPSFSLWFTAILRYRYQDFCRWRKIPEPHLPIEEDIPPPFFDDESSQWHTLRQTMENLKPHDKLWIKWFYLPEEISPEDLTLTRGLTGKSYLELLDIQRELITHKLKDIENLRQISMELSLLFDEIANLKHLLQQPKNKTPKNLQKLIKLETKRDRLRKQIFLADREPFRIFGRLFSSPREGKHRLALAETRLKYLIHDPKGDPYVLSGI